MQIRPAGKDDQDAVWSIIAPTIRAGETYALPLDMPEAEALAYWMGPDRETFVAEDEGRRILGTYYLRANQPGGGDHVANCGYMTAAAAVGRGVARRMCEHSLEHARLRGYRAMQFNFVVSTMNEPCASGIASVSRRSAGCHLPSATPCSAMWMRWSCSSLFIRC